MTSKKVVDDFLTKKNIAVVGVSRKKEKIGNAIYRELKKKEYHPFGVNPAMNVIDGDKCYSNLTELKGKIDSVIFVVPGVQTEHIVKEAHEIGVNFIWMQQGSESKNAMAYCKENNIAVVYKECIFMFLEPVTSIHGFHRWIWKFLGKLPK